MFIKFGPRDLLQIGHLKFAHACIMLCVQSGQGLYGDHGNIISLGSGSEVLNQSEGKSPSRQALLWQIRPNPIHLHIAFMITIKLVFLQNLVPLISPPSKASVQQGLLTLLLSYVFHLTSLHHSFFMILLYLITVVLSCVERLLSSAKFGML